ncbi:MAG: GNAT family N-acetyltransferase [Clostridiaceae bacterium]|nr:GNAT family N-acetyltransferase [Eubacteriales bacterium]
MQNCDIKIKETTTEDLANVLSLWNDGDVMKFVGFPDGLGETMEGLTAWLGWIEQGRPRRNHYSIYEKELGYCGEAFYSIDEAHGHAASLDIKLFGGARGKGIAHAALSCAIERAFENGAQKVWVDPNPQNTKAIALYERLRFVKKEMPAYLAKDEGGVDFTPVYMELTKE